MDELVEAVSSAESAGRSRNVAARLRPLSDFGLNQALRLLDLLMDGLRVRPDCRG